MALEPRPRAEAGRTYRFKRVLYSPVPMAAVYIILPIAVSVCSAIAAVKHGPVRAYWIIGAAVCLALTGVINYFKDRRFSSVRNAAISAATALNNTGGPLVVVLGKVTAAKSADEARREVAVLIDKSVGLAHLEIGRSSKSITRAVFYSLNGDHLERETYHGSTGCEVPRKDFVRDRSDHDNEALRVATEEGTRLVTDLKRNPPSYFLHADTRPYASYIAVPVRAGNESFGLLTADSDGAYALRDVEKGFLILIAGVLAAGMAHVKAIESTPPGSST